MMIIMFTKIVGQSTIFVSKKVVDVTLYIYTSTHTSMDIIHGTVSILPVLLSCIALSVEGVSYLKEESP